MDFGAGRSGCFVFFIHVYQTAEQKIAVQAWSRRNAFLIFPGKLPYSQIVNSKRSKMGNTGRCHVSLVLSKAQHKSSVLSSHLYSRLLIRTRVSIQPLDHQGLHAVNRPSQAHIAETSVAHSTFASQPRLCKHKITPCQRTAPCATKDESAHLSVVTSFVCKAENGHFDFTYSITPTVCF